MFRCLSCSAALLAGVFNVSVSLAAPAGFDVEVKDPYIQAKSADQAETVANMWLENTGSAPHAVTSVECWAAENAKLENAGEDKPLERIELPAGSLVELRADGPHISLSGIEAELKPGDSLSFVLFFEDGSQTSVVAPVRAD